MLELFGVKIILVCWWEFFKCRENISYEEEKEDVF